MALKLILKEMLATSTLSLTTTNTAPATSLRTKEINYVKTENCATLKEPKIVSPESNLPDYPSTSTVEFLHNLKINNQPIDANDFSSMKFS